MVLPETIESHNIISRGSFMSGNVIQNLLNDVKHLICQETLGLMVGSVCLESVVGIMVIGDSGCNSNALPRPKYSSKICLYTR